MMELIREFGESSWRDGLLSVGVNDGLGGIGESFEGVWRRFGLIVRWFGWRGWRF